MSVAGDAARGDALSFDVEDYFQVQALEEAFPREQWDRCVSRVESSTGRLLDLLAERDTKATFFTLGWVAERQPRLVRRIVAEGHELASHGYAHYRVDRQTPEQFRQDIRKTKSILEDLSGERVRGYRAATFSVGPQTGWAFRVLEEEGYAYSSSVYPVKTDFHSFEGAPRFAYQPEGTSRFWEFPITTLNAFGRNLPMGGGGYFRLLPYAAFRQGLRMVQRQGQAPIIFYLHPWEVDPKQPRPSRISLKSRVRHYLNLSRTEGRVQRLLKDFSWNRVDHVFARELSSLSES
jgi:polysaccharide deacetylase family protein (PEP-CTERM system associated)